ncbi:hypothetical protein HGP28_11070 [Vibrio sp. SM6]|uniref:Flavodoxin n=1 Tax=Vibrio agarilyticus TaxID=2726741 RepID=A0A7X8YH69_9VIBR|nr:hypothetical protein [Vibrio agarilyticus]NLS13434.1 hypothetical protein [Vibrio agarilyticus]
MTMPIADKKNQWLAMQVEVEFPTPESLTGRAIYQTDMVERTVKPIDSLIAVSSDKRNVELYLADFHRLTIMFALQQAKRWASASDHDFVVEYLTQIILSPEHELYVGFESGEPVGAAIVTQTETQLLISDLVYQGEVELPAVSPIVTALVAMLDDKSHEVLIELPSRDLA